jgi:phosphatidylglycerol---prolipoprotein diacylglyceryl transferase
MLPILQVGPLALQTPGLILLLGIWIGLWLAERYASRRGQDASSLYNLVLAGILFGLAGGRLFYVLSYPEAFLASPRSIISINPGLFDIWGGLLSGLLAALVYGGRKKLPFWSTLDALTPGLAVFAVAIHLANLASGNGFGSPTQLPWAIELWGAQRHPTQVYESLAAAMILVFLLILMRSSRPRAEGTFFLVFVALSAGARLFLEAFRGDSVLIAGGLRSAQVIAWIALAASLWLIGWRANAGAASGKATQDPDLTGETRIQDSA